MIIFPADASVPDLHFHEIWERNIPLVTVDRETTTHADHVGTDEELGGQLVADHLLKLGHKRLAHVNWVNRPGNLQRRRESFLRAAKQAGAECKVFEGDPQSFSQLALQLLQDSFRPTAVFCATDLIAIKVYSAAAALGLKIPDDVSVVGYADFPFAEDLVPPLTTVRQDPYTIGTTAAKILLDRVLNRSDDPSPQKLRLKPEAVIRKSTAEVLPGAFDPAQNILEHIEK